MSDALGEWDTTPGQESAPPAPDDPRLRKFTDALSNAEGALRVAQAKADAYGADDRKEEWQRVAATVEVEKAQRKMRGAALELEDARAELAEVAEFEPASGDAGAEGGPATYYGSVDEFMREWLCHTYARHVDGRGSERVWRSDWWRVPEAVSRLDALWRAWEHLRLDPSTGLSVWWRDHADHHMAVLMDPEGPFRGSDAEVRKGDPLACAPPPDGMFPDERDAAPGQR